MWICLLAHIYCLASRYPEVIPLKRATAQECAEGILDIFARNGVPDTILSDQGSPFMGSEVRGGANSDYSVLPSIKWFCRTFSWHVSPHVKKAE